MNKEELEKIVETATGAVNAAVNPHGFKAVHMDTIDDTICGEPCLEVWFTLWFTDEAKQKEVKQGGCFEAKYCFLPSKRFNTKAGDIYFGIMDGEWVDLPADPAKACGIYGKWAFQQSLEQLIAEAGK